MQLSHFRLARDCAVSPTPQASRRDSSGESLPDNPPSPLSGVGIQNEKTPNVLDALVTRITEGYTVNPCGLIIRIQLKFFKDFIFMHFSAVHFYTRFRFSRVRTLLRSRVYTMVMVGTPNSMPTTPPSFPPTVIASNTQMPGKPILLPTTRG